MEHHELFQKIIECIDAGTSFALVQVLKTDGSTPLKIGARALVDSTGHIEDTIGGGAVEAQAQQQTVMACAEGKARVFDFELHGTSRQDSNPTCGGAMRVLIDPTIARARPVFTQIVTAIHDRQPGILETRVTRGNDTEVTYQWQPLGDHQDTPEFITRKDQDVLRNPILPLPHLIIAGAGHVGQALAVQAVLIGFAVTVLDDRPAFCTRARFPVPVALLCQDMPGALSQCRLGPDTYIVILTRSHQFDAAVLEACIQESIAYIGMIGSRRKIEVMRRDFVTAGLATAAQFERVCAPIGLDIGSVTAAEIATSITAQLIAVRRRGAQA
ncbi:MAG: XdhC family protein [Phycisphaeraceae bacterium]|nr:XdhC family protein [Phycisphaeraceae bacterium]